jgi:hypothetical protein
MTDPGKHLSLRAGGSRECAPGDRLRDDSGSYRTGVGFSRHEAHASRARRFCPRERGGGVIAAAAGLDHAVHNQSERYWVSINHSVKAALTMHLVGLRMLFWRTTMSNQSSLPAISRASRRRLARRLVGSPLRDIERELILETLVMTCGNRTASAQVLGLSVRTLRNKISEYSSRGFEVAPPKSGDGSMPDDHAAPAAISNAAVACT